MKKSAYAWFIIGLCSLFLFYKYLTQVSPSIMTNELMRAFHVDGAGLGNLAATFFYSYMVMQLFVGPLLDRYNPRWLTTIAMLCAGAGALVFAHTGDLFVAEWGRAMMGVGAAFATVCYLKMASVWFPPERFAFVGGLLATAVMVGSFGGQVPLSLLMTHTNWHATMSVVGWLGVIFAGLYVLFMRLPSKSIESAQQSVTWQGIKTLLLQRHNWLLLLYSGLAFSPLAVLGGLWGNPFLQEAYHINTTQAAMLTSWMFIGFGVGSPIFGWLSDKLKTRFKIMLAALVISLVSLVVIVYLLGLPYWLVSFTCFLFGAGVGGFMLGFAVGRDTNPLPLAATVVALINTGDAAFGAFTEPFIGRLLDEKWQGKIVHGVHHFSVSDYQHAFIVLPVYILLAAIFLFNVRKRCQ